MYRISVSMSRSVLRYDHNRDRDFVRLDYQSLSMKIACAPPAPELKNMVSKPCTPTYVRPLA